MLWIFVKKVEGGEQLHSNRFDEAFYDLIGKTVNSLIDLRDYRFKILGPKLFERRPWNFGKTYWYASIYIFCWFVEVACVVVQSFSHRSCLEFDWCTTNKIVEH
jgi:hypothetical protein